MSGRTLTMGQALTDVFHDAGIGGEFFACEADAEEITIWRSITASDGGISIMVDADGEVVPAMVAETFDLHRVP